MKNYLKRGVSVFVIVTLFFYALPIGVTAKEIDESNLNIEQNQQMTFDDKVGGLTEGKIEVIKEETTADGYLTQEVSVPLFQDGYYSLEKDAAENISTAGLSNDKKKNLKNDILEALKKAKVTLDVSKYNILWDDDNVIWELFKEVVNENPDLYYVSESVGCTIVDKVVVSMSFDYDFSGQMDTLDKLTYERAIQSILSNIKPEMTTAEKILTVHESLCEWVEYDRGILYNKSFTLESFSAFGPLVNKRGVCSGYSLAFIVLMQRIGVEAKMIISPTMNHAWNLVKIDDNWYHIDVTWDDWTEVEGGIDHDCFLQSDEGLRTNSSHDGWENLGYPSANDASFEKFYLEKPKMFYDSGKWIYIGFNFENSTRQLCCSNIDGSEEKILFENTQLGNKVDKYSVWDGKIYYTKLPVTTKTFDQNERNIFVNNLNGTDEKLLQIVSTEERQAIENLAVINGKINCLLFNPDITEDLTTNYLPHEMKIYDIETDLLKQTSIVSYRTHIQNIGWQDWKIQDNLSGTLGKNLRIEAIEIKLNNENCDLGIEYCTHIENIGWQDWVADGQTSGTSGKSLRIEAIKIRLTGEDADKFDVYYRPVVQNFGLLDWAKNGESAGTAGFGYRLEGMCINVVPKDTVMPGPTELNFIEK